MAGHSKWANIKRQKARVDAVKGKTFTQLSRAIIVAARNGLPDPAGNFQLRTAIEKAKAAGIPNENIERAIAKGAGTYEDSANLEEIRYEGYGVGGVAILIEALTDNRNRTAGELRAAFSKNGGNLGETLENLADARRALRRRPPRWRHVGRGGRRVLRRARASGHGTGRTAPTGRPGAAGVVVQHLGNALLAAAIGPGDQHRRRRRHHRRPHRIGRRVARARRGQRRGARGADRLARAFRHRL